MVAASATPVEKNREAFLADLTEAALGVAVQHGANGPSVELEIDLWNTLKAALRDRADRESHQQADHRWEERLADLTDAAYRSLLRHGFHHAFVEFQIDLWKALRQVVRRNRFLPVPSSHGADSTRLSGLLAIH